MLKFLPFKGPVLNEFIDPDTGYHYKAKSRGDLLKHIITYRVQNKLPLLEGLNQVIDNYLCTLPENEGKCTKNVLKRGWLTTIKGGVQIIANIAYNGFAPQALADRRAETCVKCPYNSFPDKDEFTKWTDYMAENMVGDRKAALHDKLGSCSLCDCVLKGKVFYAGKVTLTEEQKSKMKDVNCWQLEIQK